MHRFPQKALLAVLLLFAFTSAGLAQDVSISWIANTESDLAGYKVYFGTAPGTYGNPISLGTGTTYTLTGLPAGTYYIAITAFNTSGLESGYSNEVSTTIAGTPSTSSRCDINGNGTINALDLQVMVNVILGAQAPSATKGDLNGDGRVDALDLQVLANVILGLRVCPL